MVDVTRIITELMRDPPPYRALADIIDSIDELRYYRNTMLVPQPGPDSDAAKAAARAIRLDR